MASTARGGRGGGTFGAQFKQVGGAPIEMPATMEAGSAATPEVQVAVAPAPVVPVAPAPVAATVPVAAQSVLGWYLNRLIVVGFLLTMLGLYLRRPSASTALDVRLIDVRSERERIDAVLKANGDPSFDEILAEEPVPVDDLAVINAGLDCAVAPTGDQCPPGYALTKRTCVDGYCCQLAESAHVDMLQKRTGVPSKLLVGIGVEMLVSGIVGKLMVTLGKNVFKLIVKLLVKITAKIGAKLVVAAAKMGALASTGPVGLVLAAVDALNTLIDLYDPRGYNQFGSNVAFRATRDQLEYQFIVELKNAMPGGPPFIFPWFDILDEMVDVGGKQTTTGNAAIYNEMSTSIEWLSVHEPARYAAIVAAANAGAVSVESQNTCAVTSDACSSYATESACLADPNGACTFAQNKCTASNFLEAALNAVPLKVRDAHFYDALQKLSPGAAAHVKVFDRARHPWFVGMPELPYAITLTEKGRDKANAKRTSKEAPLAVITSDYRAVGVGTWKFVDKLTDLDGIVDTPALPGKEQPFKRTEDIPRLVDKKIAEPLCLITIGEILRSICEDKKSGGIEALGPALAQKTGAKVTAMRDLPRDDLNPYESGVRFDMNTFECKFTDAYCERAGLTPFVNEFNQPDCKLRSGQAWAEMVFGTTLTREVVTSMTSMGDSVMGIFNPARNSSRAIGESCKVLSECKDHLAPPGKRTSCCAATAKDGEAITRNLALGIAGSLFTGGLSLAPAAIAANKVPRTCQVLEWTSGKAPVSWCPFDSMNPKHMGKPLKDGDLCGVATTCERCTSGTHSFWRGKGFTACGTESKWADGKICAAGTTCAQCLNAFTTWSDGAQRCGKEPQSLVDGAPCLKGTSCKKCVNPETWSSTKSTFVCGSAQKAALGQPCGECAAGLLCCDGVCAQGVKAPGALVAQCPNTCRGNVGWPLGTCGLEWGKTIASTCEKCKWSNRDNAECADCMRDATRKKTNPTGEVCESDTAYACPKDWLPSGRIWTDPSKCYQDYSEKSTRCKTYKTTQSCPPGERLAAGSCWVGALIKRSALKTECTEYYTDKKTRYARAVCTRMVPKCPIAYRLDASKKACESTLPTETECAPPYTSVITLDAGSKCAKRGACPSGGWKPHPNSTEHCIRA